MSVGAIALPQRRRGRFALLALIGGGFFLVLLLAILGALAGKRAIDAAFAPSPAALADIPADYLALYQQAAAAYGLDWAVLAAIGSVESDHGRSAQPGVSAGLNSAGCCAGPMQFNLRDGPPSSWDTYAVDGNNDGLLNAYDPADAIPAAARLLQANGAPADYAGALFAYNQAGWYVDQVLAQAARYRGALTSVSSDPFPTPAAADAQTLLASPNFRSYNPAWTSYDLAHGLVDPRLLTLLLAVTQQHQIGVWVFKTGHPMLSEGGEVSNHYYGRAVDIASVDGQPCDGSPDGACGRLALELAQVHGPLRLGELIYCFDADPTSPDNWAQPDHCDHIHAGYKATPPIGP